MDFIHSTFINLCLLIDTMIYGINVLLFDLFNVVAKARFPENFFNDFLQNIYVVIGIFMMFRVAFSLIQMLSNPDMLADKEKGAGKLASRIVIALALIIMVPFIFSTAFSLQNAILQDGIIEKLILGNTSTDTDKAISDQGKYLSSTVFKAMITTPDSATDDESSKAYKCVQALSDDSVNTIGQLRKVDGNIDCFKEKVDDEYVYDYKFVVSSIATGMVAWLMAGFCIDIGLRLVKLTFLQLIAPVCIVTYVGGGKDNSFNKWIKMTISTYVSVFLKLVIIFFMIFMASKVTTNIDDLGLGDNKLALVVVILGILVFAKNAPKLIGDLFGVQIDQEGGFKGLAKVGLLAGAAKLASGGVKTGTSKLAGGLLAMKHGKSFSEGASGGFKNERKAGKDLRLEQKKAAHDSNTREKNYNKGKEIADNMAGSSGTEEDKLKEQFGEKYGSSMYKSDEAKKAKFAAERNQELSHDRAKAAQKAFSDVRNKAPIRSALSKLDNYQRQIDALRAQGVADTDARMVGLKTGMTNQENILKSGGYYDAKNSYDTSVADMQAADIALGDATKVYDDLKARHEELQKIDKQHADMQQQYDTYKLVEKGGGL